MRSIAYHIMNLKVTGGRINVSLLNNRLDELADQSDSLFWLNRLLLFAPAWVIRVPFGVLMKLRKSVG